MPARKTKKQAEPEKDSTTQAANPPGQPEEPPEPTPAPPSAPEPEPEPDENENDDEVVAVPFGGNAAETATLLLAAAEEQGDQGLVRTGTGVFYVPRGLAKKAGVEVKDE